MSSKNYRARGFTLMELMVSMAIGSIVLFVAASMLGTAGDSYDRIAGDVASDRDARAAISQLTLDLSSALFHKECAFDTSAKSWPSDSMGFLTLQPLEAQTQVGRIGDVCAVHYYIQDITSGGSTVRCLMRGFLESAPTFAALSQTPVPPIFTVSPADEIMAFGVVSFEAKPKFRNLDGVLIDWSPSTNTNPNAIDFKLIVARKDLVSRLTTPAAWDGSGNHAKLLGNPTNAHNHADLDVYGATIRFGNAR